MKLLSVSLQNYRNIPLAKIDFDTGSPTFFLGKNGQGKSNMLEGIGYLSALRSFRTRELAPLIRNGEKACGLFYRILDDDETEVEVEVRLEPKNKEVSVDGAVVKRMTDYVSRFPVVVFCADDLMLIKGGPQGRRRFFDLLFSMVDPNYLNSLQSFHRSLKERNALLKAKSAKPLAEAYDRVLAEHGWSVIEKRRSWLQVFEPLVNSQYALIAPENEQSRVELKGLSGVNSEEDFLSQLGENYERDLILGNTSSGPQRDDFQFSIKDFAARSHASDGQLRCLALALRLAQSSLIMETTSKKPVVLLDDILGELDHSRKKRFWQAFDRDCQLIVSGTEIADSEKELNWRIYEVNQGEFRKS